MTGRAFLHGLLILVLAFLVPLQGTAGRGLPAASLHGMQALSHVADALDAAEHHHHDDGVAHTDGSAESRLHFVSDHLEPPTALPFGMGAAPLARAPYRLVAGATPWHPGPAPTGPFRPPRDRG